MAKKMCYKKGTKKVEKYEFGTQKMVVPPKAGAGDVLGPTATGAATGLTVGGPWGAVIGGAIGLTKGIATSSIKNKQNKEASNQNAAIDAYNTNFSRSLDPQYQPQQVYGDGTSGIQSLEEAHKKANSTSGKGGTKIISREEELKSMYKNGVANDYSRYTDLLAAQRASHRKIPDPYAGGTKELKGGPVKEKTAKEKAEESRRSRAERFKDTPNIDDKLNQEAIKYGKNEHGLPAGDQQFKINTPKAHAPRFRSSEEEYGDGTNELNGKPAKVIEVEKRELIFQKDPSGKFKLREDHKDSPTHKNGGEDTLGLQGDIIFPADMREEALEAYSTGDNEKLESLRQSLPADKNTKMAEGTKAVQATRSTIKGNMDNGVVRSKKLIIPTFETGTGSLSVQKTSVNPAAINYTDYTDLAHIKGNKNAFNYPSAPSVGYVPSQNVPDVIGFGGYLAAQDKKNPSTSSKAMKYKKGTRGIDMYGTGVDGLDANYGVPQNPYLKRPDYITGEVDSQAPQETPVADSGMFSEGSGVFGGGAGTKSNKAPSNNNFNGSKGAGMIGAGLELAPTIYNTFRGLQKPVQTQRNYYTPEQYNKVDRYNPERRAAQESYRIEANNLRNNAGGSQGLYLANQAQAANQRYGRIQDINNHLISDNRATDNANTDLRNAGRQMNLGLKNEYNTQDLQNSAQGRNFMGAAATGVSDYSQQRRLDRNLTKRDESLTGLIGTQNYDVVKDPTTSKYRIKYKR